MPYHVILTRPTYSKLHQMIHERLQADVVGEDGLGRLGHAAIARGRRVRRGRVELGEQETGLGAACVADDEAWEGEAVLD